MHKARAFFFVCLGILCLVAAYHFGATNATAQAPSTPTEVAVLSGVLADGQTIPLPVYADGTTAVESECRWIVSLRHVGSGPPPGGGPGFWREETCSTDGRTVHCYAYSYDAPSCTGCSWAYIPGEVNYLIIATRGASLPTSSQTMSMGQLKTKYAK